MIASVSAMLCPDTGAVIIGLAVKCIAQSNSFYIQCNMRSGVQCQVFAKTPQEILERME